MNEIINEAIMWAKRKEEEIYMNIIKTFWFDDYESFRKSGYRIEKEVEQISQTKVVNNIIVYKVKECYRTNFILESKIN